MDNNLKAALYYLGKYVNQHEQLKSIVDGEWLTFTMLIQKHLQGAIHLVNPNLTIGIVNTNEINRDDDVIIMNEFPYKDEI